MLGGLYLNQRKLDQAISEFDKLAARQPNASPIAPPSAMPRPKPMNTITCWFLSVKAGQGGSPFPLGSPVDAKFT